MRTQSAEQGFWRAISYRSERRGLGHGITNVRFPAQVLRPRDVSHDQQYSCCNAP